MLAKKNEYMQEAADSIYMANADEIIRQRCLAREEAERHERTIKRDMKRLEEEKAALNEEIQVLKDSLKAAEEENINKTVMLISKKRKKGYSISQIADALEEDEATIEKIIKQYNL